MIPDETWNKCVSWCPITFFLTVFVETGESGSPSVKPQWTLKWPWALDCGRSDSELWLGETEPFLPLAHPEVLCVEDIRPPWEWRAVRRLLLASGRGCVAERERGPASPSPSSLSILGIIPDSSRPHWGTPLTAKTELLDSGPSPGPSHVQPFARSLQGWLGLLCHAQVPGPEN